MYNVKGPSKNVNKAVRRGISQNMENIRDVSRNKCRGLNDEPSNGPKPVFQRKTLPNQQNQKFISQQHEEIINFINDSWNTACSEIYQLSNSNIDTNRNQSIFYYEDEPSVYLQNFKPFDLESWWGKRLYAYVTGSQNGQK